MEPPDMHGTCPYCCVVHKNTLLEKASLHLGPVPVPALPPMRFSDGCDLYKVVLEAS